MIRPAAEGDAEAIARLHLQSWRESYVGLISEDYLGRLSLPDRSATWSALLAPGGGAGRFNFVAEQGGEMAGFASGGPLRANGVGAPFAGLYDGEFYAIYVLEKFKRRGVGRELFKAVVEELSARGFKKMLVWVLERNAPARKFYEAAGGIKIGESKIFIDRELEQVAYGWPSLTTFRTSA